MEVRKYAFSVDDDGRLSAPYGDDDEPKPTAGGERLIPSADAGRELDRLARAVMQRLKIDYPTAFKSVFAAEENAHLAASYGGVSLERGERKIAVRHLSAAEKAEQFREVSATVDRRIRQYIADHTGSSYEDALRAVLAADADLRLAYVGA